ncbi:hypothetical protein Tco_0550832 [Tanacetum coccineum]
MESSTKKASTSSSEDEEYAMVVRDVKKLFRRRGKFDRQPREEKSPSESRMMTRMEKLKESVAVQALLEVNVVCLKAGFELDEWIKDSGCSKQMTGNKNLFSSYQAYDGGNLGFESNLKDNIIRKGMITHDSLT